MALGKLSGTTNSKGKLYVFASSTLDFPSLIGSDLLDWNSGITSLSLTDIKIAPENLTRIGFALIELFGFTMTEPFFFQHNSC